MSSCHQTSIFRTLGQHWTTLHWSLADWLPGNRKWQWPLETPPARRNWADFVLPTSHWRSPRLVEVHQRPQKHCNRALQKVWMNMKHLGIPTISAGSWNTKHQNIQCSSVFYSICWNVWFNYISFFCKPLLVQSGLECILPPSYCSAVKTFK